MQVRIFWKASENKFQAALYMTIIDGKSLSEVQQEQHSLPLAYRFSLI